MGFLGIGGQGGGHLLGGAWTYVAGGYAGRSDVQVLAVCDVWRDRRERAAKQVNDNYAQKLGNGNFPACRAYTDFRQVLEREDIDAVLIATPAHWHATMSVMAAMAGKDIYCEKPTAVTVRESQAVLKAVRRYARTYQAGTQQRSEYGGKFRLACELVRSGRIGTLQSIYAYRDGGGVFWPQRFGAEQPVPERWIGICISGLLPGSLTMETPVRIVRYRRAHWGSITTTSCNGGRGRNRPVEIFMDGDRSAYKYASGVTVFGKPFPNEPIGGEGGACFVGSKVACGGSQRARVRPVDTFASRCSRVRCTSTGASAIRAISWSACARGKSPFVTRTSRTARRARSCWAVSPSS